MKPVQSKTYPKLYKKNSAGTKVLTWSVVITDDSGEDDCCQETTTGDTCGGKQKVSVKYIPGNNQRSPFDRAVLLMDTQFEKKIRLGYYRTEEEAIDAPKLRKPMLASEIPSEDILLLPPERFPLFLGIKYNGLRCLYSYQENTMFSRELKVYDKLVDLKEELRVHCFMFNLDYLDMELYAPGGYPINEQVSMVRNGSDKVKAMVFDVPNGDTFSSRVSQLQQAFTLGSADFVELVETTVANNPQEVLDFYKEAIAAGHEGITGRSADGEYKWDNNTSRGIELFKVKPLLSSALPVVACGYEDRAI